MLPVIEAPDVELWSTGWLRTALAARSESYAADVFVSNRVPNPRYDRMVTIRHDGGPRVDMLHQVSRIGVNVWGTTEKEVTDLARLAEGLLLSVRASPPVVYVESMSGPSPIEDAQPRRYFVVEVVMRGQVI